MVSSLVTHVVDLALSCIRCIALQAKLRDNLVVKGDKDKAVSELEAGRRTIVRDPDDPTLESNMQDSLYVGREDDLEEELRAAYAAVRNKSTGIYNSYSVGLTLSHPHQVACRVPHGENS